MTSIEIALLFPRIGHPPPNTTFVIETKNPNKSRATLEVKEYQAEIRHAFVRGGPGAIVSGVVWLSAAITAAATDTSTGFAALFFGGMLIFPIAKVFTMLFYNREPESKANPGGLIALETVFPMIGGLFAAWLLLPYRPDYVFGVSAIAVGAHYFGFRSAYGDWTYWALGAILCALGVTSIILQIPPGDSVAFLIAVVEILFGLWFIVLDRREVAAKRVSTQN
ncbi:MAG: hypothetical protein AAF802_29355 [Planctomycetota bacterium]